MSNLVFVKNSSTSLAIANLHEYILKELDCNRKFVCVFIELEKAFEIINHDVLLYKLKQWFSAGAISPLSGGMPRRGGRKTTTNKATNFYKY